MMRMSPDELPRPMTATLPPPTADAPPVEARNGRGMMSEAEYLHFERTSTGPRHEFVDGELIEMSGSSRRHNLIAKRVERALDDLIGDLPFETHRSDLRLRVRNGRHRYPDVMLVPDPPELLDDEQDTVLDPVVLVEILSRTTRSEDRGRKLANYRAIPSVTDYLILSQDAPHCEHHVRLGPTRWDVATLAGPDAAVPLAGLGGALVLGPLYPADADDGR